MIFLLYEEWTLLWNQTYKSLVTYFDVCFNKLWRIFSFSPFYFEIQMKTYKSYVGDSCYDDLIYWPYYNIGLPVTSIANLFVSPLGVRQMKVFVSRLVA